MNTKDLSPDDLSTLRLLLAAVAMHAHGGLLTTAPEMVATESFNVADAMLARWQAPMSAPPEQQQ